MQSEITEVRTFGDVRQLILQTIMQIRDGGLSIQQGAVIAANMKCLNDNMQIEINAVKLSVLTEGKAAKFGQIRRMGANLINDNLEQ